MLTQISCYNHYEKSEGQVQPYCSCVYRVEQIILPKVQFKPNTNLKEVKSDD